MLVTVRLPPGAVQKSISRRKFEPAGLTDETSNHGVWPTNPPEVNPDKLIACWDLLRMIDHQNFDRAFLRFQLQAQLLLQGGNEIWTAGIVSSYRVLTLRNPIHRNVVLTSQACRIDYRVA